MAIKWSKLHTVYRPCSVALKLLFLFADGSDGLWHLKHHKHHNHKRHHTRQRRQEWSPSQAIHEKRQGGNVRSEITFGHETQVAEEWVFLTRNATVVKAHIGSTAVLPCEVKKESQFGMVCPFSVPSRFQLPFGH